MCNGRRCRMVSPPGRKGDPGMRFNKACPTAAALVQSPTMATRGGRPRPARRAATAANPADPERPRIATAVHHISPQGSRQPLPHAEGALTGWEAPVARTTLRESIVRSRPVSTSLISVSQPVVVRCVDTALYPLITWPFGEAAITSFIACPTKPRNSPARRNGTGRLPLPRTLL